MRRNKQPKAELTSDAEIKAPKLYKRASYCAATQRWWDTWASSPQAEVFMATDWERLQQLAVIVEQYWQTGDKNLMAEIRLNEERLGATVRDRQSLRMSYKESDTKKAERPSDSPSALPENVTRLRDAFGT
ncbi:hypothetical protein [Actinomadura rubrisoli]|uniref:P27 family phage terminase small subunit n=1 Tax=Actinomadura rubrisoli TaxID=2530368 RepID=A0A4R5CB37_9ACTN|nr:hypothetical protein [Actinomadura rubrisoli]TDD97161.1 hypothetical protein E1298_01625 [Actinomadura rubrisoli]